MNKPLINDAPYPSVDLCVDCCAASELSRAYATSNSELTAICQYLFHHFNFECMGMDDYAETLLEIALAEMKHLSILAQSLIHLGAEPVFSSCPPRMCNFFSAASVKYSTSPECMLMDDIAGEMGAIKLYRNMLCNVNNECVCAIIQRIILDEELHVKVLSEMLDKLQKCR